MEEEQRMVVLVQSDTDWNLDLLTRQLPTPIQETHRSTPIAQYQIMPDHLARPSDTRQCSVKEASRHLYHCEAITFDKGQWVGSGKPHVIIKFTSLSGNAPMIDYLHENI